jgi:hypothetical protein
MSSTAGAQAVERFGPMAESLPTLARLAAGVAPLVGLFILLERWLVPACRLPPASYFEPVIGIELVRVVARRPLPWLVLAALGTLALLRGRLLWRGWSQLEHGRALQLLISGVALVFAWTFSTYDVNLYLDRLHAADRVMLVVLAVLACWRPVFLLFFLPLLLAVMWQFDQPLGSYSFTDKSAPLRVLQLFLASFLWQAVTGGRRADAFVLTAGCLVAAHYWIPGLEKLRLGWLAHGQLHHLTLAAWQNGWLVSLDPAGIARLAHTLARFEPLSLVFTVVAEAGALFFFWRRGVALALLPAWVLLHAGIFATSGICFWKWVALDAGFFALLLSLRGAGAGAIFGPGPLLLSLALIGAAPHWCAPVRLGWFDTRLAYTYRYTVAGPSGRAYSIAPSFFAPYDLRFSQNRFDFLTERPALVSTYGMTQDPLIAKALLPVLTLAEVEGLEARLGSVQREPKQAERFDDFMRRFFSAWNRRGARREGHGVWQAPLHIWTAPREPAYAGQEPVARVLVDRVTTLWNGERLLEVRVERVRDLAIDTSPSLAAAGDVAGRAGIGANPAVEPAEDRREDDAREQRSEAKEVVDDVGAPREAHQRHQRRLEVAVPARDLAAAEAPQQEAKSVLRETEEVARSFVDLEQEWCAQHERAPGLEHAVELGDGEIRRFDVFEHLEQEDRVEAGVFEAAQIADVRYDVRPELGVDVHLHHPAPAQRRHTLREQPPGSDAEHASAPRPRFERRDLALQELAQVFPAETVGNVLHEGAAAQQTHATGQTPAQSIDHADSPRRRGMLAPAGA